MPRTLYQLITSNRTNTSCRHDAERFVSERLSGGGGMGEAPRAGRGALASPIRGAPPAGAGAAKAAPGLVASSRASGSGVVTRAGARRGALRQGAAAAAAGAAPGTSQGDNEADGERGLPLPGWVSAPVTAGPTCWAYFHR